MCIITYLTEGIRIIIYQLIIFFSIIIGGAISRKLLYGTTLFWGIWTIVMVFALPLAILQAIVIFFSFSIAKSFHSKAKN